MGVNINLDMAAAVDEAIRKIRELFSLPLVSANVQMTDWLQNGIDVTFKTAEGSLRSSHVRLIDADKKEKNLALELLKRLLEQHIRKHAKKNMTQYEIFSEMLDARLAEYLRGLISNEEVIQELPRIARELKTHAEQASELGLTEEEQAFYDALTRPQAVKDFYENDTLVAMAKELTEALRSSKTIDWRQKESI